MKLAIALLLSLPTAAFCDRYEVTASKVKGDCIEWGCKDASADKFCDVTVCVKRKPDTTRYTVDLGSETFGSPNPDVADAVAHALNEAHRRRAAGLE